jgi:hypothetical protein
MREEVLVDTTTAQLHQQTRDPSAGNTKNLQLIHNPQCTGTSIQLVLTYDVHTQKASCCMLHDWAAKYDVPVLRAHRHSHPHPSTIEQHPTESNLSRTKYHVHSQYAVLE